MFQFTIGMDPNLFEIGPFVIAWHAIAILIAIVLAVKVTRHEFSRKSLSFAHWDNLVLLIVAGGIIGARLFFVIDHLEYHLRNPLQIFALQDGGLAIYGAVFGGFVTTILVSRYYRMPSLQVIDAIAPGLLLAQAFGRIGCIINGDAWGARTDSAFAFVYTHPDALLPNELLGEPTYPYPFYDLVINMAIFAVIWPLRKRNLPHGALFAIFAALYAASRFMISFMREERVWFLGLQEAQVVAVLALAASLIALVVLFRRRTSSYPAMTGEAQTN